MCECMCVWVCECMCACMRVYVCMCVWWGEAFLECNSSLQAGSRAGLGWVQLDSRILSLHLLWET